MAEQVTIMVIKVDLQCGCYYKKIQKILCEIPQVKDRTFNQKQNTVTITVVCCNPEKVRQKICCMGGDIILGIDIMPPKQDKGVQKPNPSTTDPSPQTTQKGPRPPPVPPPPIPSCLPMYVMGGVYVCPPCHNRRCGWFHPCNCHFGRPSWPMCHDGCGRPAHKCRCRRPPMCPNGCGRPAFECKSSYSRAPMCHDGCGRPAYECESSYSRPLMCHDGCGRPAYECESSCSLM